MKAPTVWAPHPGSQTMFLACPVFECLFEGTRGPGKGLPNAEPVYTPTGWREIGDLAVGDLVCTPDGGVSPIIGVFPQGNRPTYEIEFFDGSIARCDDQHIWNLHVGGLKSSPAGTFKNYSMDQVLRLFKTTEYRLNVPVLKRLEVGAREIMPIDPYMMGLFLGDGSASQGGSYCTVDDQLARYALSNGFREIGKDKRNDLRNFSPEKWFWQAVKSLGLGHVRSKTKFIPKLYLHQSHEARLALLQGLMDTDGTVDKEGCISFSSSSLQLARDTQQLCRSLGARCTMTQKTPTIKGVPYATNYNLYIQPGNKFIPFRLQRKVDRIKPYMHKHLSNRIERITELGEKQTTCIKIASPDGLFITRDYVVTHNTDALLMSFAQYVGVGFGPEWRGIIFRETYPQLADVVKKTKRWFKLFFPAARFNESTYVWKFPEGEELLLRSGIKEDSYWDFHGHEYPFVAFEELTNWRSLAFYEMMHSCCRSSSPGMPRMVRATTNPYGRGHAAVKERFRIGQPGMGPGVIITDAEGRERTYVHGDIRENTALLANDPSYMATLQGIKDPNRRKAWLYGSWDINVGAFLEHCWNPAKHIVKPFPIPTHWKVWRAMDWGFGKPYAVLWFAKDPEGKTYIWREMYGIGKDDDGKALPNVGSKETPAKVAQRIIEREKHDERMGITIGPSFTGPDLFAKGGGQWSAQNSHAETMRQEGVKWRPAWAGKGSRAAGAMEIIRLLETEKLAVFSTCEHWLRTVPTLEPSADDPDDVDSDGEDHCFTGDTLVSTKRGPVPLQDIVAGDIVLNHRGQWVPCNAARMTRRNAKIIRLVLASGAQIECTPDHRFYFGGGFVKAEDMNGRECHGWDGPAYGATAQEHLTVVRIESAGFRDVGCIHVPTGNTFTLAVGPVVHNCYDATRQGLVRITKAPDEPDGSLSGDPEAKPNHHTADGRHRLDRTN